MQIEHHVEIVCRKSTRRASQKIKVYGESYIYIRALASFFILGGCLTNLPRSSSFPYLHNVKSPLLKHLRGIFLKWGGPAARPHPPVTSIRDGSGRSEMGASWVGVLLKCHVSQSPRLRAHALMCKPIHRGFTHQPGLNIKDCHIAQSWYYICGVWASTFWENYIQL